MTDKSFLTGSVLLPQKFIKSIEKVNQAREVVWLKRGILLYFLLLIFEGALRKWFLPGLSNILLVIRDPIALCLIALAWSKGLLRPNLYLTGVVLIGLTGFFTALFFCHGNLFIALYGARILLLQFPLIFVIGSVYSRDDVIKMGRLILLLSIPMAMLITVQFYSPQSAWVNKGLGDSLEGAGFSGALGYFRPPATFSFITGTTQFFGLVTCFIFYFWLHSKNINRIVLLLATVGLLAAIPFSISRTLFYQVMVTFLFTVMAVSRKPKHLTRFIIAGLLAVVFFIFLSNTSFFKTPIEAFTARFTGATEYEGGLKGTLVDRYLGGLINPISGTSESPFFGYGLGIGTNVGGSLLTGNRAMVIYAEDEWARLIGELGPLLGLGFIFFRISFSIKLAWEAYKKVMKGDLLPWILLSFCLLMIPQGQWGQPTALGFSVIIGGLTLASFKGKQTAS